MRYLSLVTLLVLGACGFEGHGDALPSPDAGPDDRRPDPTADGGPTSSCPDGDDDADGVCNADDDWPCGAKPTDDLDDDLSFDKDRVHVELHDIEIDQERHYYVVDRSAGSLQLALRYYLNDHDCNSEYCPVQLEYGFDDTRLGCLFDGDAEDGTSGNTQLSFSLPSAAKPTAFAVRVGLGRFASCSASGGTWYFGAPPASQTIAYVCVR